MASRLAKLLSSITEADLEEIEADIAKLVDETEKLRRLRDTAMAALGMESTPHRVQNGGSTTSRYREKIVEYLACTDEPISGYKVCTDLNVPLGSQSYIMACDLFERKDKGYVLSDKGRLSAGLSVNGH